MARTASGSSSLYGSVITNDDLMAESPSDDRSHFGTESSHAYSDASTSHSQAADALFPTIENPVDLDILSRFLDEVSQRPVDSPYYDPNFDPAMQQSSDAFLQNFPWPRNVPQIAVSEYQGSECSDAFSSACSDFSEFGEGAGYENGASIAGFHPTLADLAALQLNGNPQGSPSLGSPYDGVASYSLADVASFTLPDASSFPIQDPAFSPESLSLDYIPDARQPEPRPAPASSSSPQLAATRSRAFNLPPGLDPSEFEAFAALLVHDPESEEVDEIHQRAVLDALCGARAETSDDSGDAEEYDHTIRADSRGHLVGTGAGAAAAVAPKDGRAAPVGRVPVSPAYLSDLFTGAVGAGAA
ncbi:hypothetical protein BDK51DRAFT_31483 [Blyttiomyces helicus]|uniref:Uncharacterized protein n=1 Tax=Blyttiomyces helicus TaxID=388810 RepID=A0A4P9W3Z3_9FUNG|nr:hypothetical protein BDK51DRAFT_31483 [Blyttiomyces helicus]|eukprot:RKO86884.1 hypothetical protein BDK51DRAFT_31483 [Blyttiomyces helicus]